MWINKSILNWSVGLLACLCMHPALAGEMGEPEKTTSPFSWVTSLSIAYGWVDGGESQTFLLKPDIQKAYIANNDTDALVNGELFFGVQYTLNTRLQGQLGLAVAASSNAHLTGDIWEDADPDLNNYYYDYKVNHAHLALKAKLIANMGYTLQPYVGGSAGVGYNRAHDFIITPKIFEEIPAPLFRDNSKAALTYTLEVGLQGAFTKHCQGGIGYQFADWGKSELDRAPGQTLNTGLSRSHLQTNSIQFSLSYIA